MRNYLVVANQTLGGDALLNEVRDRISAGESKFHILVPATPPDENLTYTEGEAEALAQERLGSEIERLKTVGAEVTGEIGGPDPVDAIADVVARHNFHEIILCTFPPGVSRWIGLDVIKRTENAVDIPVTHVISPKD